MIDVEVGDNVALYTCFVIEKLNIPFNHCCRKQLPRLKSEMIGDLQSGSMQAESLDFQCR